MKIFHVFALIIVVTFIIAGCDEGMNMTKPLMMGESEVPVEPTEPEEDVESGTMGEIKTPEDLQTPEDEESVIVPETPEEQESETPITQSPEVSEPEEIGGPVRPGETPLSEEEAREKAYAVMKPLYPVYLKYRRKEEGGETFRTDLYEAAGIPVGGVEDYIPFYRTLAKIRNEEDPSAIEFVRRGTNSPCRCLLSICVSRISTPKQQKQSCLSTTEKQCCLYP